jgi:low temperature requirement protein LtrA
VRLTGTRARDPHEPHRAATPLELLFDLTFVVAVAAVVPELAHAIVDDHPIEGLIGYSAIFFAIWWAWMNFSWFASAFDCDDAFYRVLTMVQMAGVLVLAAGVGPAFESSDYRTAVVGYVIMRIAMVVQWLRVAVQVPEYRANALRYAVGISAVQCLWVARLFLGHEASIAAFLLFGVLELLVPLWADGTNMTPWHPHHIAERYGLFTIIVLGESVLATATAVIVSKDEAGVTVPLLVVAVSSLALLFAMWWLYFLEASGPELERHRELSWLWGYGHYIVFASLAAVGAGIEVVTEAITHAISAGPLLVAYSLALPIAIYLVVLWLLHTRLGSHRGYPRWLIGGELVVFLGIPLLATAVPIEVVVALLAVAAAGLIALKSTFRRRLGEAAPVDGLVSVG